VKLKYLDSWNERRKKIAQLYFGGLNKANGILLPVVPTWADPTWHLFVVRNHARENVQKRLSEAGIGSLIHYPIPPHLSAAYQKSGWIKGDFPVAEAVADEIISLPMGPHLTADQAQYVISTLLEQSIT
jgi:dTDP-4-amino-4,6-dideoxygalactose transaminase